MSVLVLMLALIFPSGRFQTASKPEAGSGDPEAGKVTWGKAECRACHGDQGQGTSIAPRLAPPGLDLLAMMHYVRQPNGNMLPFPVELISDRELIDIYAYLKSLAPPKPAGLLAGDAQRGKKLFSSNACHECHGSEGQGANAGPRIGPRIEPPAMAQPAFAQYVRHPAGQMPPYDEKAASGQDLADIYSFLKSIPPPAGADAPHSNQ